MRLSRLFVFILLAQQIWAQTAGKSAPLTRTSLVTTGLSTQALLTNIYVGDFLNVTVEREDPRFGTLFAGYLNAYGQRCDANLPKDKVEITRSVCVREQYQVNGFGTRVGPSTCIQWEEVGTGVYADPTMYAAKLQLDRMAAGNALRDAVKIMTNKDPLNSMMGLLNDTVAVQADMTSFVQLNACTSPAVKRFEENLRLFAMGKQPVDLSGATSGPQAPGGAAFRDSNYTKLLEDLVLEQSKTWAINRYIQGSMTNVTVSTRDPQGRPAQVVGRYIFNGFSGRQQGSVTTSFSDGIPECLYFFDFPNTCRTADRRIAASYAKGGYQQ